MMEFCLHPETILSMLTEIGRHRALTHDETDIIEAIVCRGHRSTGVRFKWTPKLERELLRSAHQRGGIRKFADKHGLSPMACHKRISRLRDRKSTAQTERVG